MLALFCSSRLPPLPPPLVVADADARPMTLADSITLDLNDDLVPIQLASLCRLLPVAVTPSEVPAELGVLHDVIGGKEL